MTPREQCKELMLQGLSYPQIARIMGVKHNSVRVHVRKILQETGSSSQLELLALEIERLKLFGQQNKNERESTKSL